MPTETARSRANQENGTKSARTRRRIMECAAGVLARKGVAGTRLSDIAEAADVQAPAIYYYFDSREALIEAVVMEGTREARRRVEEALELASDAGPVGRLLIAVEAHLRQALVESDFTLASIRNAGQLPQDIRDREYETEVAYGRVWRALIEDVHRAGLLNDGLNLIAAQMLLLGAMNWAPEWWNPKVVPLEDVIVSATSMVVNGLIKA